MTFYCQLSPILLLRNACGQRVLRRFLSSQEQRALQVAVIGAPNVGKSLLTNQVVKAAVSAVSSKMDTTTRNIDCLITEGSVQLCLVDSPGTVGMGHAKQKMGRAGDDRILSDPEYAVSKAQHILVCQDATATGDYIHHRVMHILHRNSHIPASLVLNKIDLIKDRKQLLELTRILTNGTVANQAIKTKAARMGKLGVVEQSQSLHNEMLNKISDEKWNEKYRLLISKPTSKVPYADTKRLFMDIRGYSNFDAVFYVSALTGEGVDEVRNHLLANSEKRDWFADEMAVTNKSPQQICVDAVRAALLDTVPADVAYKLKPKISEWVEEGEVLQIVAEVPCAKERDGRLVIGKGGRRIVDIARRVNDQMHSLFQRQLFIRILVKHNDKIIQPL